MFESGPYGRAKNVLTPRAKRGQKKKKKKKNIQPCLVCMSEQSSVFFFFFFFFFLALMGPVGVQIRPCHKGQVRTCRLVAIGTFDPGPDGADVDSGPVAFEMYKKKKKKKKKKKTIQPCLVCMSEQSSVFFFFFFFFFFGPEWPGGSTNSSLL